MESNTTWPQFETVFITTVETEVALLQTIAYVVSIPIGTLLISGIILYEREGVDSQKRSIFNQLISFLFGLIGMNSLIVGFFTTLRCWIGPMGPIIGSMVSIIRRFNLTSISLISIEILIYKNLCVIKPLCMMGLNDSFWSTYIPLWNALFSLVLDILDYYARNGNHPPIYRFISGEGDMYSKHK